MSKAMVTVGVVVLSVLTLLLVNIIQSYSSGNELDYGLLKDTTEAAMLDAVDLTYYQTSGGIIRMDKEKFVESFVRRFANNVNGDRYYNIRFYDLNETPPKASVKIGSSTTAVFAGENFDIKNSINAIIESAYNNADDAKKVVDKVNSNGKGTKPGWYPSYSNNLNEGGSSNSDKYYSNGGVDYEPTKDEVRQMFYSNERRFYSKKRLVSPSNFKGVMVNLFRKRYNIGDWGMRAIEQYCDEIYDSLPQTI